MNRNDKLIISYGLLVDTADAIRAKKGTSALISPTDFPSEVASISGGGESPTLTLGYTFANNKPSNAYGTVTLTSYDAEHDGYYDLYWANDDGIMSNYTKLNILTVLDVDHSSTPTVFDKFNQYNAIPKYATKLVACLTNDENKTIKASYNLPSSKLWQSGDFGNHIGSEGELSDVHYQYDTGSDDWGRAFTYLDQRESVKAINIAGDLTSQGTLEHLTQWKNARDTYALNTSVYACNGNHESYNNSAYMVTNPTLMRQFLDTDYVDETVNYFTKTINGILHVFVPIFEGIQQGSSSTMFSATVLAWLENVLEEHRNERVIVYAHCPPQKGEHPYGFADADGKYDTRKMWGYGGNSTRQDRKDFLALLSHYKNVFWISGHTHLKYMYQEQYSNLNIVRLTDGAHYVHVSSLTVPRDIIDGSISGYIYAESEGTILDVYENCLRFRTRNFVDEKFYGLGEYVVDEPIEEIPSKTKVLDHITASKTVMTYNVGDTLDTGDIVTTAFFTDETTQTVQGTYNTQNVNMLVAGTYSIGVSYTFNSVTKTTTVSITVVETQTKALASISAVKTTTTYMVNDTLSTSDIVVTATYTDSTSANVTASAVYDTSNVDMTTAGTYTIGVSYTEDGITKTATISITVSSSSDPTVIMDASFVGTLTAKSQVVQPTINDSKGQVYSNDYACYYDGNDHAMVGKVLYYRWLSTTGIDGSHGVGMNGKMCGSPTSSSGKQVFNYTETATSWTKLTYTDGSGDAEFTNTNEWFSGRFRSSSSATASFPISVNARLQIGYTDTTPSVKTLASIVASKVQSVYSINDTLSTSDITAVATYSDNTTANISNGSLIFDTSNVDMTTAGT